MAHQHDLDGRWPPQQLVDYLWSAPTQGPSLSVLPRPRPVFKAPDGLAYLDWDDAIPRLAAQRGITIGYGGRSTAELPILGEFSADYVAEIAISVAAAASWDGIKLLIQLVVGKLHQQLTPYQQTDQQTQARIGIALITDNAIEGLVVTSPDPEEAGRQAERVIRAWGEVRSPTVTSADGDNESKQARRVIEDTNRSTPEITEKDQKNIPD